MIKNLSNSALLEKIKSLVKLEREATYEVLTHLREVERRMLYAQLGYSSLFAYAMAELKYSEDECVRRIAAMRLLREVPGVETSIKSGVLSLSNLTRARSYFKAQGIQKLEVKKEILQRLENKSRRQGENILARLPLIDGTNNTVLAEKMKLSEPEIITISSDLKTKLEMVRKILNLGLEVSYEELLHKMSGEIFMKSMGTTQDCKLEKHFLPAPARVAKPQSRHISRQIREAVYIRDRGCCNYVSKITGKRCNETKHLQIEHCKPFAIGGESSVENLMLLCPAHNSLRAVETFGRDKMQKFLPKLQE